MFKSFKSFDERCRAIGLVVDFEDLITPDAECSESQKLANQTLRRCISDLEDMVAHGRSTLPPLADSEKSDS